MPGYECPFCGHIMAISQDTHQIREISFYKNPFNGVDQDNPGSYAIRVHFYRCPNCEKISIIAGAINKDFTARFNHNIYPAFTCNQYPEYIPQAIRSDYEEACAIVNLSPKASATLSRRCLQGMIRDFWGIKKGRLVDEIDELKDKVPADQWKVIDGLRRLGNIGAHMEKDINTIVDIDPEEAQKLVKLIELLMKDWYINRNEQQELYRDILTMDKDKQEQKNTKK